MFNNVIVNGQLPTSSTSSSSSSSVDELLNQKILSPKTTTSEITTDDIDRMCDKQNQIEEITITQFAQRVLEFSSQYGSDCSISYTACNITGRPSKFPNYGDFPETYAMRTYGKWWDIAPSHITEIMPQTVTENLPQDFIVIQFEDYVYPQQIYIFETYNPGAIVKLWSFTIDERWICLWEYDSTDHTIINDPRVFTPTIKNIKIPTRIIRIEFNHRNLDYFTEIDGVLLEGVKYDSNERKRLQNSPLQPMHKGPIQRKLEKVLFNTVSPTNHNQNQVLKDLENFIAEINCGHLNGLSTVPDDSETAPYKLKNMPPEILLKICSYLDLVSLFRISQTCRKLNHVAHDPSLYTEVNLMPYWDVVDASVLQTFSRRCCFLKKIDLSWCGLYNNLTSSDFKEFIRFCGKQITHLRLNSVKFLSADSIETVSLICSNLRELSLRNLTSRSIRQITGNPFSRICHLERLDLFHVEMPEEQILLLLKNNKNLKHLNLAFSQANMDETAITISQYNKQIQSIDMWKSKNLSSIGLLALATTCTELEEVDFGWCLRDEASPGESLRQLLKSCPNLKKLFLAAIRGLTDRDLESIANLCPNLEQLDLLGVMSISTEKCHLILTQCKNLILFDLSFCVNLDDSEIAQWRETFSATIKRSFVRSDIDYSNRSYNVIRNIN